MVDLRFILLCYIQYYKNFYLLTTVFTSTPGGTF